MKLHLDQYDRKILSVLQQDASITNLDLSKRIGLSPSACLSRTKNLRESGVIKRFATILDEKALGMEIQAFVLVNVSPPGPSTMTYFIDALQEMPEVLECYTLTGNADFLLKIVAPDVQAYGKYLIENIMSIPNVSRVESSIVVETNKMNYSLPIPENE